MKVHGSYTMTKKEIYKSQGTTGYPIWGYQCTKVIKMRAKQKPYRGSELFYGLFKILNSTTDILKKYEKPVWEKSSLKYTWTPICHIFKVWNTCTKEYEVLGSKEWKKMKMWLIEIDFDCTLWIVRPEYRRSDRHMRYHGSNFHQCPLLESIITFIMGVCVDLEAKGRKWMPWGINFAMRSTKEREEFLFQVTRWKEATTLPPWQLTWHSVGNSKLEIKGASLLMTGHMMDTIGWWVESSLAWQMALVLAHLYLLIMHLSFLETGSLRTGSILL